jgi:hypothetical protein
VRPNPPSAHPRARLLAVALILLVPACAGQDLARQEGIRFRGARFASFHELPPESALYRQALSDALALTDTPPEHVARLPRVLRGRSLVVDPPYLGRTRYEQGSIFVWEGTEVPLRLVLTHEMIHWVLYQRGRPDLATDEALVERLCESMEAARAEDPAGWTWPGSGDQASRARWRELDASDRNRERRRVGRSVREEPDAWALAWDRASAAVPQHP